MMLRNVLSDRQTDMQHATSHPKLKPLVAVDKKLSLFSKSQTYQFWYLYHNSNIQHLDKSKANYTFANVKSKHYLAKVSRNSFDIFITINHSNIQHLHSYTSHSFSTQPTTGSVFKMGGLPMVYQ